MIPIVFITDENFIMQTHIAIKSVIENKKAETEYDIFIVMAECPEKKKKELEILQTKQVSVHFVSASLEDFRDIKQLAHIPIACLLKFNICELVPQYDKIIYLDGDICVRGDLTDLYRVELADNYAAAVPSLENIFTKKDNINAGVMLFNAKKMREDKMAVKLLEVRKSLGDRGSMDQQTFNLVISDKMGKIPCKYNCIPSRLFGNEKKVYGIDDLNALYHTDYRTKKDMLDDAVVIHYATGEKPWKYTYIPCADEWYAYYGNSIYKDRKLKRDTFLTAHAKGFFNVLKKKGIRGVLNRLYYYTLGRKKVDDTIKNWG